jgi:pimeloyl-ACP methyl ester carboxylesterase
MKIKIGRRYMCGRFLKSTMKHTIFYIPGLGDHYDQSRRLALNLWKLQGVEAILLPMNWYSTQPYDAKYAQAYACINAALARGNKVSLVGESAGASIALALFATLPGIEKLITIAGVNSPRARISSHVYARAPAFKTAVERLGEAYKELPSHRRQNIYTFRAKQDAMVNYRATHIEGAREVVVNVTGHFWMIILSLTFLSSRIIRLVK